MNSQQGTKVYRAKFSRLGENLLTVRTENGRAVPLEFFVTEPLETLIRKRASFITEPPAAPSSREVV